MYRKTSLYKFTRSRYTNKVFKINILLHSFVMKSILFLYKVLQRKTILFNSNFFYRPANSNGLWCHILLPAILLVYTCFDKVSLLYKITSLISVGLLCYCILFILFLSASNIVLKAPVYTGCLASSLIATVMLHIFLNQGIYILQVVYKLYVN